jgi:hypothetical protein
VRAKLTRTLPKGCRSFVHLGYVNMGDWKDIIWLDLHCTKLFIMQAPMCLVVQVNWLLQRETKFTRYITIWHRSTNSINLAQKKH